MNSVSMKNELSGQVTEMEKLMSLHPTSPKVKLHSHPVAPPSHLHSQHTVAILALCSLLCGPAFTHDVRQQNEAQTNVTRLANIQKNWGSKMNSPGAEIILKETRRERTPQGTAVYYRLSASGLATHEVYTLFSTTLALNNVPALEGITFDRSGLAVCAGTQGTCTGDKPNDPIDLAIFAAKGEPKRFAVMSADKVSKAFTYVVPFPILGNDRNCTAEAILLTPKAEAVLIHGSGFVPQTEVHFTGLSEQETQQNDSKADAEGNLYQVALPYVKGQSHGKTKITLQSNACNPSLSFDWGPDCCKNQ